MYPELKKAIEEKYGTEAALARSIGWSRQRMSKLTNGKKKPDVDDVAILVKSLDLPVNTVFNFFIV